MPDEFESKLPPQNIKVKYNNSYYYKSGGIKAEMDFYGYLASKELKIFNLKIDLTMPKKEMYIKTHKYYEDS